MHPFLSQLVGTTADTSTADTINGLRALVALQAAVIAGLTTTLNGQGSSLTTLQTAQDAQTTSLSQLQSTMTSQASTLTQHTSQIANRLRKDQADATPYTLSVAPAVSMDNAVRKSELIGGLLRPYRVFRNVTTTATGASGRPGQDATITDALGLGASYKITTIRITTVVAPVVASVITIKAGSTTIFSTTVLLTQIPVVGKILDLVGSSGNTPPADIPLPVTLTCTASAGAFDIFVDGIAV